MIETELVEVLHVILETICVLMSWTFFQILLSMFFFEIIMPKVKPIAMRIFYRPPNENDFFNLFWNGFQQIDNKTNEIYLLEDFDINLIQNGKFILKENQPYKCKSSSSALVNKNQEFCQIFSLTEIIKESNMLHVFTTWPHSH